MSEFEKGLANVMGSFMEVNLDCVEKQNQEIEQLQQENQQLKEKINTYENPEDLTLMFMYCDEQAKDKIKELQELEKEHQKINGELREENKKLKEKIKVYENPDDMTGIFENCTELNVNLSSTEEMKRDLYKEVIEEVREEFEKSLWFFEPLIDENNQMGLRKTEYKLVNSDNLLQILDKGVKDE